MLSRARFLGLIFVSALTTVTLVQAAAAPPNRPTPLQHRRPFAPQSIPNRMPGTDVFGRVAASGEASTLAAPSCAEWTELSPNGQFWRYRHTMVYDSARDRLLIFAGTSGPNIFPPPSLELWALSLSGTPTLTKVETQGIDPSNQGVDGVAAIYDPVRDRLVVCGGYEADGTSNGEMATYELNLSGTPTWSTVAADGTWPPKRAYHTAVYDAARDRMVIFGGDIIGEGSTNTAWALSFSGTPTWTQLTPSGTPPVARNYHTAVYDGPRDRMVVFGGYNGTTSLNDTWALALAGSGSWSQINLNNPPAARSAHTAIVDAPRNRMLVVSGFSDSWTPFTDVWSLSFTNPIKWTQLSPTGTAPVAWDGFASVYDPVRQRMLSLLGDEFWGLSNLSGTPAWAMLAPSGQVPMQRTGACTIYDPAHQNLVVFGGYNYNTYAPLNDLWQFSLSAGTWTRLTTPGPPSARSFATAVYDPTAGRMVLFGGDNDGSYLNDTWQLSLAGTPAWTQLSPAGSPPAARHHHTAILDGPRNRVVVYGGANAAPALADVWALSLAGGTSWSQLSPTGGPAPARADHAAVFDALRNRMLAFGGNDTTTWALELAGAPSWSLLNTTGVATQGVTGSTAVYDAPRDRMLVMGGDTYALTLSGTPTWGRVAGGSNSSPYRYHAGSSAFDTANDRWLVFGGDQGTGWALNDVQRLTFPSMFPLTVDAVPAAGGWVDRSPYDECLVPGSLVTLTATPAADYGFTGWSGDASGSTNPIIVTMNAAKTITANFATYPVNVSVSPTSGGSVTRNPNQATYPAGSQMTLTAAAAVGYAFVGWSGDASGSTNPLTITVDGPKNIAANFNGYPVNVTVSPTGAGTVTKNPNQATYAPGSQVALTATASAGYAFVGWSGDASGSTNPLTVTVDGPKSITATFVGYPVNITVSPTGTGTVTKNPNQATYAPGSQVTLTASTSPYPFQGWSGDATGTTNPLTITVDATKNITASFQAYSVTVSASPGNGGSVTKSPNQSFHPPGGVVTLTAVPGDGFAFTNWSGDTTDTVNPLSLNVYANKNFVANFATPPPSCGAWSLIASGVVPSAREGTSAVWDPVRHRILVFGGRDGSNYLNEVWQFTAAGGWTQLSPTGSAPSGREAAGIIYDPTGDRLVVFGGNNNSVYLNDLWQLSLTDTPTWTPLTATGTPPVGRNEFSTIYDPSRNRIVIFGGFALGISFTNEVWALTLTGTPSWSQLSPAGPLPPGRRGHVAVYDPVRDRMLIQEGRNCCSVLSDLWSLSFAGTPTWSQLSPSGQPPQRFNGSAIYDPVRDRMLVVGGQEFSINLSKTYDEVWSLSFKVLPPMWSQLSPGGVALGSRYLFSTVYEPETDLLVAIAGSRVWPTGLRNDAKRLDCAGGWWLEKTATANGSVQVAPPKACFAPNEVATLMASPAGGAAFNQWLGDASGTNNPLTVTMDANKTILAEILPRTTDVDDQPLAFSFDVHPNPSFGRTQIEYTLPHEARVQVRVFDVAGREVAKLVDGTKPGGRHTATWSGTSGGRQLRPGVYLVRLETPAGSWVRRLGLVQ